MVEKHGIKHIAAGFALVAALSASAAAQAREEIGFGILSTGSNRNLRHDWQPPLADMARRTAACRILTRPPLFLEELP